MENNSSCFMHSYKFVDFRAQNCSPQSISNRIRNLTSPNPANNYLNQNQNSNKYRYDMISYHNIFGRYNNVLFKPVTNQMALFNRNGVQEYRSLTLQEINYLRSFNNINHNSLLNETSGKSCNFINTVNLNTPIERAQSNVTNPNLALFTPNFTGSNNGGYIVADSEYNYVRPHYNDYPNSSYQNNIVINRNKEVQANYGERNTFIDPSTLERPNSSNVSLKMNRDMENDNVEAHSISTFERYEYVNAYINIVLFETDGINFISDKVYRILYKCDYPRGKVIPGKTHIEVNFKDVKREYPKVTKLQVDYLDFDSKIKYSNSSLPISIKDVEKCDLWVKTNDHCKYIIQFSFLNENGEEKFRICFHLRTSKELQRMNGQEKDEENTTTSIEEGEEPIKKCATEKEKETDEKSTKGHHDKRNKIKQIKDLLIILKQNDDWNLLKNCTFVKLKKDNDLKNDFKKLNEELKKSKIINKKMENMKDVFDVINSIENNKIKNNLLILCFNIVYSSIINHKENSADSERCMTGYIDHYKKFIKNYNIGYSRFNDIVIIDCNDLKGEEKNKEDHDVIQNEERTKRKVEQNNKRERPIYEERSSTPDGKRPKMNISSGDSSKTNYKNSDVECLLVNH